MSNPIVEDLKELWRITNQELVIAAAFYIENIENDSAFSGKILSFENFLIERRKNPDSKWIKITK